MAEENQKNDILIQTTERYLERFGKALLGIYYLPPLLATLDKLEFKKFFRWLTSSMSTLSNSAVSDQDDLQFDDISSWGTWHKLYNK